MEPTRIIDIRHPMYRDTFEDWCKWRLAYEGGKDFVNQYVYPFSSREKQEDIDARKRLAYNPGFAKEAITEIKDAIYQRMVDVVRINGPESYRKACEGLLSGVDLDGSTMNTFIGTEVLKELLPMKRVGVLVDNPANLGRTIRDKGDKHPYLSLFNTESILSWNDHVVDGQRELTSILLREEIEEENMEYGLLCGTVVRYRHMRKVPQGVTVTFYNGANERIDEVLLPIPEIPFTVFEIQESLMKDIADHQIALLNLEATDIQYLLKCNYAIYYEFYDPTANPPNLKPFSAPGGDGTSAVQRISKDSEVEVGMSKGRRFPEGTQPPGFINPDPATVTASMAKEAQIKADIRRLVNLNLIAATAEKSKESADSKQVDQRGLDSALSYIGLILQTGEMKIAKHWAMFEGSSESSTVKYPQDYSLKSDAERREEAESLNGLMHKIPSETYRRIVAKRIARITVGPSTTYDQLKEIENEIDAAPTLTSDPDQILADHEAGLVDDETASRARGYAKGVVEQARKDRAERIRLTMEAQGGPQNASAARGASDFGGMTGSAEKQGKQKRGKGKKIEKVTQ